MSREIVLANSPCWGQSHDSSLGWLERFSRELKSYRGQSYAHNSTPSSAKNKDDHWKSNQMWFSPTPCPEVNCMLKILKCLEEVSSRFKPSVAREIFLANLSHIEVNHMHIIRCLHRIRIEMIFGNQTRCNSCQLPVLRSTACLKP